MNAYLIPALSIKQPWAWLIAHGYKPIENRSWKTHKRGEIYIHAGKKFDFAGYNWVKINFPDIPMPDPNDFEKGGIVGKATIASCVSHSQSDWFFGAYGFELTNPETMLFIPCLGKLGFFNPNLEKVISHGNHT